jgi:hypothetical protein
MAAELDVAVALDPLIRDPSSPAELFLELELERPYWRISGLGRQGPLSNERLEDLQEVIETHPGSTVVFESAERWKDAKKFAKLID